MRLNARVIPHSAGFGLILMLHVLIKDRALEVRQSLLLLLTLFSFGPFSKPAVVTDLAL